MARLFSPPPAPGFINYCFGQLGRVLRASHPILPVGWGGLVNSRHHEKKTISNGVPPKFVPLEEPENPREVEVEKDEENRPE